MEEKIFINRDAEKELLLKVLDSKGPDLVIIYGRRRVGKSRFLREIVELRKIKLSIMLEDTDYATNLSKVTQIVAEKLKLASFVPKSFRELFQVLPEGTIIILDEYSYIASATAEFQGIWEEIVKPKKIKLILSGSMIRVMEDLNYSISSPLYGRATQIIKMLPLAINYIKDWYGLKASAKDCLETFFVLGGIPRYLEILNKPGLKEIKASFFSKNSLFLREGKLFLKESFPKSEVAPKVFFVVASGETESSKIASKAGLKGSEVAKYLSLLIDYGFIEKRFPLFGAGKKDVQFYPADPFLTFWMRFVWPYYSEIDLGFIQNAEAIFDRDFGTFAGLCFEKALLEIIRTNPKIIGHKFEKIANQWGRIPGLKGQSYEIDLVAINNQSKETTLIEAKWGVKVNAETVAKELDAKLNFCDWLGDYTEVNLLIVAQKFSKKIANYNSKKVTCLELEEIF